ncbi:MAG: NADH:flavin oxidoreductase/NADH oxidase [Alphaproteobacteria bacterium]|nr:NADH:flavin oxidoreductase/NADH oxidase [Alphaproteobacteria bacterium]MDX5369264.1 NADH:flavin oxidoreductase/NADH oxidase [Alphaproteobacteria bacterium]MDX5463949.1 NADH:flavin oxidoreductase/NADH oxidase [Alphaproteobacteria bacterium]
MSTSTLFSPFSLRRVTLRNRTVLAPMQMYSAVEGQVQSWHHHHLAKYGHGGFAMVFTEALAVERRGRNTYGDLGVWSDDHVEGLAGLADTIRASGAVPAAQVWHSGPKASRQRPWQGYGPLGAAEAARGETEWQPVAPVAEAKVEGWHTPHALTEAEAMDVAEAYGEGARRCLEAGYEVLEVHGAHGYLVHSFYSPLGNDRTDSFGGGREGRMRFPIEVARAIRRHWPEDKPLLFRLSCVDDDEGTGWTMEDTLVLASRLREEGVDMIDCSSGGVGAPPTLKAGVRPHGFQVPYAETLRAQTGMPTMAVGLIRHAAYAESIVAQGRADLVCIAREALHNPQWPLHAALELEGDAGYEHWPPQYGWWLQRRARNLPADDSVA